MVYKKRFYYGVFLFFILALVFLRIAAPGKKIGVFDDEIKASILEGK